MRKAKRFGLIAATLSAALLSSVPATGGARYILVNSTGGTVDATQQTSFNVLPPLDLSDMRLWNWSGKWHASQWDYASSPIPWRYDRVKQDKSGDTHFTLNSTGAPQLQAQGGIPAYTEGVWEVDVTLPQLRDGLIVAPLWLYDSDSKDEIDFEFAGKKGLDVSLHRYKNGQHFQETVRLFAGQDFSNQRVRLGIRLNTATGVADMLVNGERVHRFARKSLGFFTKRPMKPLMEMWAANPSNSGFTQWVGKWQPLSSDQELTMTVHGFRYSPLQ